MDKQEKKALKNHDQLTQSLENFLIFIRKNVVAFAVVLGLIVIAGAGMSLWDYMSLEKEDKLHGELAQVEKTYLEKKNNFKEAQQNEETKKLNLDKKKDAKAGKTSQDDKKDDKKDLVKASGDIKADYGPVVDGFLALVNKSPDSKAAAMAALYLAEIYSEYKQPSQALDVLNKVNSNNKVADVLSGLIVNYKAGLIADQGDCKQAVDIWQKLAAQRKVEYMKDEAKLRMALCYEKMNDSAKAEQLYTELSKTSQETDRAVSEDAKKYLRLLKVRGSGGT